MSGKKRFATRTRSRFRKRSVDDTPSARPADSATSLQHFEGYSLSTIVEMLAKAETLVREEALTQATEILVNARLKILSVLYPGHLLAAKLNRIFSELYDAHRCFDESRVFRLEARECLSNVQENYPNELLIECLSLAQLFENHQDQVAADSLFDRAYRIFHEELAGQSQIGILALKSLSAYLARQRRFSEAAELLNEVVRRVELDGGNDELLAYTYLELAELANAYGEEPVTERYLRRALTYSDKIASGDVDLRLLICQRLVEYYFRCERMEMAREFIEECITWLESRDEISHNEQIWLYRRHAEACYQLADFNAATHSLERAIDLENAYRADGSLTKADLLHQLATVMLAQDQIEPAVRLFEQSLSTKSALLSEEDISSIQTALCLGLALKLQKKFGESRAVLLKFHQIARSVLGKSDPVTLHIQEVLNELAWTPTAQPQEQIQSGETEIHEMPNIVVETPPIVPLEDGASGYDAQMISELFNTAVLQLSNRDFRAAIKLLSHTLKILEDRLGCEHPDLVPILQHLADANVELGRDQEAQKYRGRAIDLSPMS